ncbi:protein ABHD11-like [Uranotaenia lowii]|uniref:protein ABHD11-like n=1 Tax=Uranotaenia lowii TaxID=190385 RepID=UPI002478CBCD|nr:protein ABHD11-like [Uranotaenia lowii]
MFSRFKTFNRVCPVELSYKVYGDSAGKTRTSYGLPVLVLHGLFSNKANWHVMCKVLQQKTNPVRKIYAIDARNHGSSPHTDEHSYEHLVCDLVELYRKLGIEKACVIGHRMGGRAMMLLALTNPQLVDRAIIVDIAPNSTVPDNDLLLKLLSTMKSVDLEPGGTMKEVQTKVNLALKQIIENKRIRRFLLANLVKKTNGFTRWHVNLNALEKNFDCGIAKFPEALDDDIQFEGPTMFVLGKQSDYVTEQEIPLIKKFFPKASIEYIHEAGQLIHSEKPDEFAHLVLDFINDAKPPDEKKTNSAEGETKQK